MKFVLISFLIGFILKINLINALPIFGEIYTEKKIATNHLAKKYCDSLEIFKSDVKSICSYDFSKSNEKEFKSFLNNYFKTRSNTPKTKVEAINPTPINPAIIPVLR